MVRKPPGSAGIYNEDCKGRVVAETKRNKRKKLGAMNVAINAIAKNNKGREKGTEMRD